MVNVSKRALTDRVQKDALHNLFVLVTENGRSHAVSVWREVLGEPEQLQLAKRVALILMLMRGVSYDAIETTLHMSHATIAKHDALRKEGAYTALEKRLRTTRVQVQASSLLEDLLQNGLPGYCDKHRRRWVVEHLS